MRHTALAFCWTLLAATPLAAQADVAALAPGTRVRVSAPSLGLRREVTRVLEVRADTLVLASHVDGLPWRVALERVQRIETSVGRRPLGRAALRGAGIGLVTGVGLGVGFAAAGAIIEARSPCGDCFVDARAAGLIAGVLAIPTGALVGTIVGAAWRPERWVPVRMRPRVGIAPTRDGGLAVAFTVPF